MTHSPLRPGSVASPAAATLLALGCGTAGCRARVDVYLHDGADHPAMIIVQGDLDTRVPPLQARKTAAGMQPGVRAEGGWRC